VIIPFASGTLEEMSGFIGYLRIVAPFGATNL